MYKKNTPLKEIVSIINDPEITNTTQISRIASRLGISKKSNYYIEKFREKDLAAIEMIKQGNSCTKVAKNLHVDLQSMMKRLKDVYNFTVLPDGKKYANVYFFDDINTEEKAYWLGFLYADGYIGKQNNLELCIQEYDRNHLIKFAKALDAKQKITQKSIKLNDKMYTAAKISLKDKHLVEALEKHGCTTNKTFTIKMPSLKSKELYRHFIRGYFDGDGSIYRMKSYISAEFSCASLIFLQELKAYAEDVVKIKMSIREDLRSLNKLYKLETTSRCEGFRFLQHLYEKSTIYLNRKYNQYCEYCRSEFILPETLNNQDGIKREWRNVN